MERITRLVWLIAALAAAAAVRAEDHLVLGVFPRYKATENITMYTPLADHLSRQLGRKVKFDPATETFSGDEEANRMRSRAMREPWHV